MIFMAALKSLPLETYPIPRTLFVVDCELYGGEGAEEKEGCNAFEAEEIV